MSNYVADAGVDPGVDPEEQASTQRRGSFRAAGESRRVTFQTRTFLKYYFVDILANLLGPFGFIAAIPCWGLRASQNMKYTPSKCKDFVGSILVLGLVFWPLLYLPIIFGIVVASGVRPDSDFDPLAETVPLGLMLLLSPLASAFKYGFMPAERFRTQVMSEDLNVNEIWDGTVDAMNKWTTKLDDSVLDRELDTALWRSGCGSHDDGERLVFDKARASKDAVSLKDLLRTTIQRNRTSWQFSSTGYLRVLSFFFVFLPFGLIPAIFRVARDRPFLGGGSSPSGSDSLEIAACVYSILATAMMFHFSFWQIFSSGGHLQRNLNISNDWLGLIVPNLDYNHQSIPLTAQNVRIWSRGREAILVFGKVYWLRLSWMTATSGFEGIVLLGILIMQLVMSLLGGIRIQLTAFMLMAAAWVVAFSFGLGLVVWIGLRIIRERSHVRTLMLRRARSCLLLEKNDVGIDAVDGGDDDEQAGLREVAAELRHLAYEMECEIESHKIRLLGLPLDTRMLESLLGGVIAISLVFYQSVAR